MQIKLKDGRIVNVRELRENEDVFAFTSFINELVEEDAMIMADEKQTPEQEALWLQEQINQMRNANLIHWCVEYNGKLIANCEARRWKGRERDTVELGIAILKEFRNLGLGRGLLQRLIEETKRIMHPHKIVIRYIEGNEPAKALYESLGFKEIARLPETTLYKGRYVAHVFMVLE